MAIARQPAAWPADLIVLTRPRPALIRLAWGSIPDQVMRQAACPVLAVPPEQTGRDLAGYELPDALAMTGQNPLKTHRPKR